MHPKLREVIDATPMVGVKTFLVTHFGKPYTAPGFGNWFREQCDKAECPDVSAHGLRKEASDHLLDPSPCSGIGRCIRRRSSSLISLSVARGRAV